MTRLDIIQEQQKQLSGRNYENKALAEYSFINIFNSSKLLSIIYVICMGIFLFVLFYKTAWRFIAAVQSTTTDPSIKQKNWNMKLDKFYTYPHNNIGDIATVNMPLNDMDSTDICKQQGLYLGEENSWKDCTTICGHNNYEYKYFTGENKSHIRYYNTLTNSKKGAYCMPSEIAHCNDHYSDIVFDGSKWACVPRWPSVFGGLHGNDIMVCGGVILDRMTNTLYTSKISRTVLLFEDPHSEEISEDTIFGNGNFKTKHKRFICPSDETLIDGTPTTRSYQYRQLDKMGNALIPTEFSHLERMENYCSQFIHNAESSIKIDWKTGYCVCPPGFGGIRADDSIIYTKEGGVLSRYPCYKYKGGYDTETRQSTINRSCLQNRTLVSDIIDILKSGNYGRLLLCGVDRFNNDISSPIHTVKISVGYELDGYEGVSKNTTDVLGIKHKITKE